MAKSIAQKLTNSKLYKTEFDNRGLTENELIELTDFDKSIGFNYDRIGTIVKFIKQGHSNWVEKWSKVKSLTGSDLEIQILLYGIADGTLRYVDMNKRKTVKFDHSHETQLARGLRAAKKLRGNKEHSIRSVGYWLAKGLTNKGAVEQVKKVQTTNTLSRYINRYGSELGPIKFTLRNKEWSDMMTKANSIGKKTSLGLWRYIERYGKNEGKVRYLEMRKKRNEKSRIGKASAESLKIFLEIMQELDRQNIKYYVGVENNKEWCIYDNELERPFFYDLTIPSLSIIVEYHGEAFHPNPRWDKDKWGSWRAIFSNQSADEAYQIDQYKKNLAESAGWMVYEIYSSEAETSRRVILKSIKSNYSL
jgi:hypothetical protein